MSYFQRQIAKRLLLTVSILSLAACGGSGSSKVDEVDVTPTPTPVYELAVIDDDIKGISGRDGRANIPVIDNDTLDDAALSLEDITITLTASEKPLTLNGDGTISVAPMTKAGTYVLGYKVCLAVEPDTCASGIVSVEVDAASIVLTQDSIANINGSYVNENIVEVLANDTINNAAINIDDVTLSVLSKDEPLQLDGSQISVASNTKAGEYQLSYQVCENLNPDNCETGTVIVEVVGAALALTSDFVDNINGGYANVNIIDVLANDTLNNSAINIDDITLSVLSNDEPLQLVGTQISVAENTPADNYSLTYQVCENLNPENCAQAMATLNVNKGVFMNGVQGVKYESGSAAGVTDENGGYIYSQGDNISFYIGATQLGEEIVAGVNLSPLDLIADAIIPLTALETRKFLKAYDNNKMTMATKALLNVLTLLYSIDKDKDASNGIVIDEAIHDSLALTDLNIYQNIYQFSGNKLSIILQDAFNQELIVNASVPEAFVAVDNFYDTLNITPQVYTATKDWSFQPGDETTDIYEVSYVQESRQVFWDYFTVDADNKEIDGTRGSDIEYYDHNLRHIGWESYEDGILNSKGVYQRNIHGKQLSYQNLSAEDVTYQTQNIYNEQGLVVEHKRDSEGDDFYEYVVSYEYDADGNMTRKSQDNDGDDDADTIYIYTFTNGLLTKSQDVWDADYDENAINVIDFERVYIYNQFGAVSQRVETNYSRNTQRVYDFIFDEDGNHIFTYIDDTPEVEGYDQIVSFTYDDKGNKLSQYSDSNGDGDNEYGYVYQYDAMNNMISQTNYQNGNFVTPSSSWTKTYDEHGNELTDETDNNGDGTINYGYSYIYDDNGNQIEQQRFDGPVLNSVPASYYYIEYQLSNFKEWFVIGY
ncbi:hypothetical protein RGQ13_11735 [Thalassotalea psychrophila]|uniref:YD repeat-containing protein n=1 Tax=Thalassotalea psychrophila TaxID=3065647 RepID=A0ABY9TPP5_9GAMM|nr:hypothetical protein RGQ13_11735 [Colwelliaceae bacterium SQ149]